MEAWPFSDPPNVAVFTSEKILNHNDWIQTVTHDEEDGAWQFHPYGGTIESDAKVVSLKTITQIDPSILELADLPPGWCAWRSTKEAPWKRERNMSSLDNPNTVDAIGVEKTTGFIILTITDSWDWSDEGQHLLALQDKLNSYLDFIEGGQIFKEYPNAKGRKIIIDVVTRFPLPEIGMQFLEKANAACADLDIKVRHTYYPGPQNIPTTDHKNLKVTYPADRRVSVWVGNFPTEDDFDNAVDTDVSQRLGLPTHIADVCEVGFDPETVPIRQLIEGFSGATTFVDAAEASAVALGISSANAALVCYYVQCDDAPEQWGSFHFLGTFVGQDVT